MEAAPAALLDGSIREVRRARLVGVAGSDHEASLVCDCQFLDRLFKIARFETERSGLALEGYAIVLVDQVDAVRPSRVGHFCLIVEFVDHRREFDSQLPHTGSGNLVALVEILRTREDELLPDIALRLPDIAGVRLQDIDN